MLKGYDQTRQDAWSIVLNHQSRRIEYSELLERTQYRCDVMGISLTSFWLKANRDVLRKLGTRKVSTRILTMDPESPALPHMIAEGSTSASTDLKSSAARMKEFFETMANEYESIETRVIRNGLPHAQLMIIDEAAFVAQYMYAPGTQGPMLRVPKETELYGICWGI